VNPLVRTQLKRIEKAVGALGEVLAEQGTEIDKLQQAREALQRQVWTRSKENAVLQEAAADYDILKQANARQEEKLAQVEERLRKVLAYTRALSEELRQ
jgi:hypothetical protein